MTAQLCWTIASATNIKVLNHIAITHSTMVALMNRRDLYFARRFIEREEHECANMVLIKGFQSNNLDKISYNILDILWNVFKTWIGGRWQHDGSEKQMELRRWQKEMEEDWFNDEKQLMCIKNRSVDWCRTRVTWTTFEGGNTSPDWERKRENRKT